MSSPGTTKREFLWPCNVGDQKPTASEGNSPLTHYLKSLDLACLQPKPCDLAIGKTALKFDFSLIGDRQVIAKQELRRALSHVQEKGMPSVGLPQRTIAA